MKRILLMLLLFGSLFAVLSIDSYSVEPTKLKPGQSGAVTIKIKNAAATSSATSIPALYGVTVYGVSTAGIEVTQNSVMIGTLEGGSTATATFPIKVLKNAKAGVQTLSFTVRQQDENKAQDVIVPVTISNPPILSISTDKQTINSIDEIKLSIANAGGAAERVTVKINSSKFSMIGTDQLVVQRLEEKAELNLKIDARNADEGINEVPLVISYQEEGGTEAIEYRKIFLTVQKEKIDLVFTQNGELITRKDDVLEFAVKNLGRKVEEVKIIIDDENVKNKEANEVRVGEFGQGESKQITIPVFADAQPGIYDLKVKIEWIEDNIEKEQKLTIPIVVTSDSDVGAYIDAKPSPIVVGGEHIITALISNVGSYRIDNVEVKMLSDPKVLEVLNAQEEQYIGRLESDDFSAVQYKVRVKAGTEGNYPLTLNIKYRDQGGVWVDKNITKNIKVRPVGEGSQKGEGGGIVYLIIAVVIMAAGYWWFRMRQKK